MCWRALPRSTYVFWLVQSHLWPVSFLFPYICFYVLSWYAIFKDTFSIAFSLLCRVVPLFPFHMSLLEVRMSCRLFFSSEGSKCHQRPTCFTAEQKCWEFSEFLWKQSEILMLPPFIGIFKMSAIQNKEITFRYFMNCFTYNIRIHTYICGYCTIKYFVFKLIQHSLAAILKIAAVNINVHKSYDICHIESWHWRQCIDNWIAKRFTFVLRESS